MKVKEKLTIRVTLEIEYDAGECSLPDAIDETINNMDYNFDFESEDGLIKIVDTEITG